MKYHSSDDCKHNTIAVNPSLYTRSSTQSTEAAVDGEVNAWRLIKFPAATFTPRQGSIQTGRANVKTTASLLYKCFDATRPVCMLRLTNMCSKSSALCFTPIKDKYPNFEVGLKCIIMVF